MGLFNKKGDEQGGVPRLPELPKLPELPSFENVNMEQSPVPKLKSPNSTKLPSLPTFPSSSVGNSFSQDTIKEAVTGGKEEEYADEFEEVMPPIQKPQKMQITPKTKKTPREIEEVEEIVEKAEPIFIRLDKFEESVKIFEKVKEQITEMSSLLEDIRQIRDEEEQELGYWEQELKQIKDKIDKVDKDIFSMLE